MSKYHIFTDSNCDLSTETRKKYNLDYLRMGVVVDGEEHYADLDWNEYTPDEFYGWLRKGRKVKTSAVSINEFETRFRPLLEQGIDILYVSCSSALTNSPTTCLLVAEDLLKEFPERKIIVVDSLNASCCLGLMAIQARRMQDEGKTIEEVRDWLEANKLKYNFHATVDNLVYMRNAGRIKGSKAFFGNLLQVKPVFLSDAKGNNLGITTVRGTKNADNELVLRTIKAVEGIEKPEIVVAHAVSLERALRIKQRLEDELKIEPTIELIGPIVGTTCGPGTIGVFCYGKEVTRFEGDGIKE